MNIPPGTRLGAYEIVAAIGAGGMGEVYRAHDSRLGRDVAIKTLPAAFSADADRLRRFEQEARAAAALNHPNILAVYDVGTDDGTPYVVSELLEGETLRARLQPAAGSSASLSVRRAIDLAIQIAHGLAAAHEKGIVHRDLKPENLFVTADGRAKILDFGLVKLTEPASGPADPTVAGVRTDPGTVMGTAGYMAPEQVRGLPVDQRTDLFAFGAVLYEMLAGRRAFEGATAADTIAAIVTGDPPDLPIAERHIPPALARIVDRCLEKAPAARFQTAADLGFALESLSSASDRIDVAGGAPPRARSRERVAWITAAVLGLAFLGAGIVAWRGMRAAPVSDAAPVRFTVDLPDGATLTTSPNISPDGRHIVFGAQKDGVALLYVRGMDDLDARPLAGTNGASNPFWSPDSRVIAFFANEKLRKVPVDGGPPIAICDVNGNAGGTWAPDGTIVFVTGSNNTVLQKVPASGGTPQTIMTAGAGDSAADYFYPWFLPDGRRFLYRSFARLNDSVGTLWIGSVDSNDRTSLGPVNSNWEYASGHLLYVQGNSLMARPFDAVAGRTTGDAVPVALGSDFSFFSASETGVLVYGSIADQASAVLTWFDRAGRRLGVIGDRAFSTNLATSPDGRRVAVSRFIPNNSALPGINIWILDIGSNTWSRATTAASNDFDSTWSPDGTEIIFTSSRSGKYELYRAAADGSRETRLGVDGTAPDWSADGRLVAYMNGGHIWILPLAGGQTPRRFLDTSSTNDVQPAISPDGRWLAYATNETGRNEIQVRSFPGGEGKYVVSRDGGRQPRWRGDGRELFFLAPDGTLMAASVETTNGFHVAPPTPLFKTGLTSTRDNHPYAVTPDGQRFLMPAAQDLTTGRRMTVLLNWTSALSHAN
ncbi:MAG TPA: protein kinase [Vicinamibacterales bacterium]|nr:protein kinase [Vicinamibacterales bacterium]